MIGEKWRMLHTTELQVSKKSKDEHANGERASKRCLVLRRPPQHEQLVRGGRSVSKWLLLQTMTRLPGNTSPNLPNNKTILFHFTTRKVEHKKHSTPNGQSTPTPRVAELTDTFLKPTNGGYKLICPPKVRRAGRGVTPKRVQKFSIIVFGYIYFFSPFFSVPEVCRMTVCIRMTVCMCGAVCGYCCAMAVGRLWRAHDVDRV